MRKNNSYFPSAEHINGEAGDVRYLRTDNTGNPCLLTDSLFDYNRQVDFNNALYEYGWGRTINMLSENFINPTAVGNNSMTLLPHTSHYRKTLSDGTIVRHDNHLHMQGFDNNLVDTII